MADTIITVGGDLTPLERQIQDVLSKNFKLSGIDSRRFTQPLGKIKGQLGEFEKSLEASNARVVAFGASAGAIYLLGDAFKGLVRSTIEVEKSLADINTVLGESSSNIKKFGNEIFNVANETSQSFETAAQAALEFSRQGLGLEETLKRTSAALTLAKISGLSAADSVEALTATINSFNDAALTDIQIVNKLAAVDARYAVSSADLAEAIKRVGSSASEAGVSLDQLIALVTSAQQTTARGGSVIGNSFKTIFTRIQRPKVLESLEEIGITTKTVTGQTLPLIQILNQLASTYDSLGAAQKSQIAELVGGVYQINILKAVVGDLSKEFGSTYAGALRASSTATNEAEKRIGSLAQTLDSQINRITNNLKRAGSVIGDLTIAPALEKVLGAANNILETFALGKEPESYGEKAAVGFLKGLGNFISGPGLILGAAAAFQIFKRLAAFVNDAGKTILGLGQASQRQAEIQAQILQLLQKNPALYSQIQSGAISVQDAAQGYLNIVNLTNAALERQKALAGQIAQVAFSGGAVPITGATRGPRRRASSGFIPNFAAEGQILESVGAANHKTGYKAGKAYQTTIHDGKGKSFRSWVNSAEKVKTFTNAAGYKATIVRPPNGFGPGTQMAAEGFVPNFAAKKAKDKRLRVFRSDAKVSSISGSKLNTSFDRKQSSYRINIHPTSTAFFESSDKRKQMDTGRKSLDAGYTIENGQIVPNSAFDKFMGAINVYKVADAKEINAAANATWEGLLKKDPSWITKPVFSQFGLSSKNARRAFFNSLRKSKLSYADIKEKFNRQNGNATNDAVYKFGSGKTMTSPEDYKKSLDGDFNNFKGAFYEAFIANKLGSKYSLSKGDYDPVDIVAKEGAGTKFKGFEVKSGSVANVSTLVNKALNSINFNSANDAPAVVDFGTFPVIQTRGSSIGGVSNFSSGFIPNFAPGDGSYTLAEYANKKGVRISQLKKSAFNAAYEKGVSLAEIKQYDPKFEYKGATAQEAARRQASVKALEQQHAYRGKPVLEKVLPWNKTVDDFGGDTNKFGSAYEQEVFAMLKKKYKNRFKTATELGLVGIRAKDGQILENNYSDVEGAVLDKKGRVLFWVEVKAQSKKRHLSFKRTGKDRVSDKFERAERKNINLPTNPRVRGIVFRNLAKGFIPNFANGYIDKVMNLESNISGNRAILDTTTGPFPFIRNSSQPNFAAAISDHGGLNNALNDSLRNQKNAGLMSGGYVPNFAAKAMLPGPEAIQEILANQKKKLITNLDFDNTLVKTKGDEEYAKAKSQEAKQAVLNKYFRNPIARMRDVKRSPLTTFGNDLLRGIRRGSIDPKYLGIMTASDNTPGLADFLLRRFRIPKKNMKFGIRGAVGKPPIEAKLGLAGKYENRKTGSGSVVDDLAYPNQSKGFIPNFLPTKSLKQYKKALNQIRSGRFSISNLRLASGIYNDKTKKVSLNKSLNRDEASRTLSHEFFHSMVDGLNLSEKLTNTFVTDDELYRFGKRGWTISHYPHKRRAEELVVDIESLEILAKDPKLGSLRKKLGLTKNQLSVISRLNERMIAESYDSLKDTNSGLAKATSGSRKRAFSGFIPNFAFRKDTRIQDLAYLESIGSSSSLRKDKKTQELFFTNFTGPENSNAFSRGGFKNPNWNKFESVDGTYWWASVEKLKDEGEKNKLNQSESAKDSVKKLKSSNIDRNFLRDLIRLNNQNTNPDLQNSKYFGKTLNPNFRKLNLFRGVGGKNEATSREEIEYNSNYKDFTKLSDKNRNEAIFTPLAARYPKMVEDIFKSTSFDTLIDMHQHMQSDPNDYDYMPLVSTSISKPVARVYSGRKGFIGDKRMNLSRVLNRTSLEALYAKYGEEKTKDYLFRLTKAGRGKGLGLDVNDIMEDYDATESRDAELKQFILLNKGFIPNFSKLKSSLSVQQLAAISDEALDKAYGYGRSVPSKSFGWQANIMSAAYAKNLIENGETNIEKIADAVHNGWNVTARKFVDNPDQFEDTEKLKNAGKLEAKIMQRKNLMNKNYASLPEEEKEKDRVVARALLEAIKKSIGNKVSTAKNKKTAYGGFIPNFSDEQQETFEAPGTARIPLISQMVGRFFTNVTTPVNYDLESKAKQLYETGPFGLLHSFITDTPSDEVKSGYKKGTYVADRGATEAREPVYRWMYGLEPQTDWQKFYVKNPDNTVSFNRETPEGKNLFNRAVLNAVKSKLEGDPTAHRHSVMSNYGYKIEDNKLKFFDRWDFDTHPGEQGLFDFFSSSKPSGDLSNPNSAYNQVNKDVTSGSFTGRLKNTIRAAMSSVTEPVNITGEIPLSELPNLFKEAGRLYKYKDKNTSKTINEYPFLRDSDLIKKLTSSSNGYVPNFANLNSSLRRAALGVRGLTPFVIDLKRKTSEVGGNNTLWHKDIVNKQFVTGEGKDKKRIYGGRYDLTDQDIHSSEYANTFVRGFVNKDTGEVLVDLTYAQKLDPEFRPKHREFVNNELDKISKRYTPKSSKGNIPPIPKRILTEYAKFTRYNPLAFNSPPESANKGFIPNFNSALNNAVNREMDAGYSRSEVRIGKSPSLATSFNPEGYGVYNSSEGSLQKGMSLAQKAGIDPKTKGMSAGHIPNFATVDAGKVFGATGGFEALTGKEQLKFTELNKALSKLANDFTLTMQDQGSLRMKIALLADSLARTTGSTNIISEASNALGKSLQQNRQAQQKQANATAQAQKSAQAMQHAKVSQRENLYRKIADVGPDVKRRFVAQRERVIKNVGASERSRLSTGVSDAAMERAQRKLQQKKLFEEAKLARQQANVSQTARTEAGMRLAKYYGKGIQSPAGNAPVTPSAGGGTGGAASGGRKGRKPRGGAVPTVPPAGGGGPVPPAGGGTGGAASGGRAGMMGDQFGGLGKAFLLNQLLSTAGSFAPEEYQEPIGKVAGAIASFSTVQALAQSFKPQEGQRPFGEGKMGDLMNTDVLKFGRKGGGLRKGLSNVASKFPRAAGAIKGVGSLGRGALSLGRSAIGGIGGAIGAFAGPLAAAYTVGSLGQDAIDYFGFTGMGGFGGTGTRDQGKEIKALEEEQKKFKTESGKALAGYLAKSRSTSGAFGEATGEKVQQGFGGILGSMGFSTSENLMKFNFGEERKSAAAAITEELGGSANLKKIYEQSGGGQGKESLNKFTEKVFATLQNAGKETGGLEFDKAKFEKFSRTAAMSAEQLAEEGLKPLDEEQKKLLETYKAAKDAVGQLQKNLQQMEKAKEISKTFQGVASSMASAGAKATAMLQIYKLVQEKEKQRGELLKTNYGGGYEGFINPQKNLDSMSQIENALKTLNDPRLKGNAVERGRAAARYMEGTTALGINMPVAQQAQLSKMIEMGQTTSNERTLNTIGMIGGRYGNNFGIQQGIGMSRAAEAAITKQTGLTTAERQLSAESAMSNVGYRTSQEMKAMTMTDPQVKALEATVKAVEESMNKLAGLADAANTNKISMEQFNQAAAALQAVANNKNAEANIGEQLQAVFNTLPEKLQAIAATNTNKIQSETSVTGNVTLELTGEAQRILKQAETLIALSKGTNSEGTPLPAAGGAMDSRKFNNCHIARLCIPNEWQAFYFWKELIAPDWFRNFYNKYSESIANWMNNKPTVQKLVAKWMKSRINKLIPKNK